MTNSSYEERSIHTPIDAVADRFVRLFIFVFSHCFEAAHHQGGGLQQTHYPFKLTKLQVQIAWYHIMAHGHHSVKSSKTESTKTSHYNP